MNKLTILRGSMLSFHADPFVVGDNKSYVFLKDALLFISEGKITKTGTYVSLKSEIPEGIQITDYSGHLITPGFIDTHGHYPQTSMIGAYGLIAD